MNSQETFAAREDRVLVACSDRAITLAAERALHESGFEVFTGSTAADAVRVAVGKPPDVALVSTLLPDADARTTIERLRAAGGQDIATAILGPKLASGAVMRIADLGADDYVTMPFDDCELAIRARLLLRLRRATQELNASSRKVLQLTSEIERVDIHDRLTGLYDRRYIELRLGEEIERSRRYGQPLSVLCVALDDAASLALRFGDIAGDEVVCAFAHAVQRCVRKVDIVARYGASEIVVVAPATDRVGALVAAERAQSMVAAMRIPLSRSEGDVRVRCTVSAGACTMEGRDGPASPTPSALLAGARAALLRASTRGRHRVEVAQDVEP